MLAAAAFLAATVVVGLLIVRELRVAPPRGLSTSAEASSSTAQAGAVPPDAVSVPALMFGAHEIRVGDALTVALSHLDATITLIRNVRETGPIGPREIRSYEVFGTRFILVAEPFQRGGEQRVSAIYLQ